MTEATTNLMFEHLRAIRADIARLRDDGAEIKARLGNLESGQSHLVAAWAESSVRMDGLASRLDRIERRLDLREAEPA
ncbi:hypothetical protein [Neoroseomonas rubea]|uniref:hypothetical protein n=1 Tax=Neoroseomonas rubea TaxID=2748666 RepID=UPI0018DF423D|nr:hypothetical protein [Roseomonas rubea]